ncbi:unnamed protein product [Ceutorhynchus assimilis]|uniref:Thioredoxin domain-containing protein 17 n=1 Tax=Ceutorhynchus assimilis TaxID=467358 RepID=A0A9N9MP96_9CUCU|nr:unnamed protein product [Ceutorhynchus assimilis]
MDQFSSDTRSGFSSQTGKSSNQKYASKKSNLTNYQDYLEYLHYMDESKIIYFLFTSTDSPISGYSWSPICTEVQEVLEKRVEELHNSVFVVIHVGSQDEWEDPDNPFRQDKNLQLKVLPTFMNVKSGKRLEGLNCVKSELLELVWEKECDF